MKRFLVSTIIIGVALLSPPRDVAAPRAAAQGIKNVVGGAAPPASPPIVVLSPTSLAFGSQTVGTPSAAMQILVSNTGGSALVISTITISGTNAADFTNAGTGSCHNGLSVMAGGSCTLKIIFTPSSAIAESAQVNIADNAAGSPQVAPLSGTGVSAPSGTPLSACQNLSTASTTYYLTTSVSATGTCFSVTADDQTLNLNGFTITYNTANQSVATSGILGIACYENDWVHTSPQYYTNATGSYCGSFSNFTVYGGTITQGSGTVAYNNTCAGATPPNCTVLAPSHPIRLGGNGSTISGPTLHHLTFNFNCPSCLAPVTDYGNGPVLGGAILHDNNWQNGKTGPTCTGPSGANGCQQYRSSLLGNSFVIQNATATTVPAQIYNNQVTGGIQGGFMCDAPGCTFTNNVAVTPGNPAIEYTNNFCIYMWRSGQTASGNTCGANPPSANQDNRGLSIDYVEGIGTTAATLATLNTISVIGKNNNTEYGGCQLGGMYGVQYDDNAQYASDTFNTIYAFANECGSAGLRLTQLGPNLSSSNNTYNAILCSVANCGATASITPTAEFPVAGAWLDNSPLTVTSPFVSTSDKFLADFAAIAVDSDGCYETDFVSPTLGSGGNPAAGWVTFSFWNVNNPCTGIKVIDATYTGLASRTLTNMPIGNGAPYQHSQYFSQWTYSGTIRGASSGNPLVGATVTVTAAAGAGGGTECSTTSTTGGAFSCTFVSPSSENQLTEFDMANSTSVAQINTTHNPHSVVVSAAGCTTNTSSLSITGTISGSTITLAGC